ncbi:MAG: transglycosylase domain-containing protein, partial [Candidatus Absconditabacteria bacterium]
YIGFLIAFFIRIIGYWIVPFFLFVKLNSVPLSTIIIDSDKNQIGELINSNRYRSRYISLSDYPKFLKDSLVSIEDRRFWTNGGLDFISLTRATYYNIKSGKVVQGASTISSQLIRNQNWLNEERTLMKKLKEFYLARSLNIHYSKETILENYMNTINFGYMNYGFESASWYYFGKSINNLTKSELIALLVIPKNPNKYDPLKQNDNFKFRFGVLVNHLANNGVITEAEKVSILSEKLIYKKYQGNNLPYVVDYIKKRYANIGKNFKRGFWPLGEDLQYIGANNVFPDNQVQISVDLSLSNQILDIGKQAIWNLQTKDVSDFGILVVDRNSYEIKTLIGGYDYQGDGGQVDAVTSIRQVGSALKPFTYLLAFRDYGLTPNSSVLDIPTQYKTWEGFTYYPKNFSLDYEGEVTIAHALSQSLNITAVKMQDLIGVSKSLNFLRGLGISTLNQSEDYYGLALTLGVGEISLYELTRAFTIFSSGGELCDFRILKDEPLNCKKIIDKKYTDMIEQILSNRYFKLKAFPLDSNLDFPDRFVFVKTGTSRNFSDNVAVGYTDNYIIGVWVGNKDGKNMRGVTGVSGAGEIFKKIVYLLEKNQFDTKPIDIKPQGDKFLKIVNPLNNSIYKINEYRKINQQVVKLDIETNFQYDQVIWTVDGDLIKDGLWQLDLGKHLIKVTIFDGENLIAQDESFVEVVQ